MSGYQSYSEYSDSGIKWLGEVPSHWESKRVKTILDRNDGGVWGEDFDDEGVIVLRSTEQAVDGEWIIVDPAKRRLTAMEIFACRLQEGDLVVTKSSGSSLHIGKTSIVTKEVEALNCCFSNFMQRLRVKPNAVPRFLWYVMNGEFVRKQFDYYSSTATGLANLSSSIIGNVSIAVPSKAEQLAIIHFLDYKTAQINVLIAKKEALLEKLTEKRAALISHAVTKGLNPQAKMKDTGVEWLGKVPAHWMVKKLKFFVTAYGGGTPNTSKPEYWDGGIPWVSPKDMKSEVIKETEDYLTELGVRESATRFVPIDSVLIVVRSGILRHTIPVARNSTVVSLNQDMKALIPNEHLEASFLHRLIQGNQKGLLPLWSKPGCTVESIEYDYMANTEIGVPPLDEQRAIVEYMDGVLGKLDRQISKAQQAIEKLQEYRSALITQAVTGKIDVRNVEIPKATSKGQTV